MSGDDSQPEDKESLARAHFPYRAEYCKTSRAACKKCSRNMEADSLKLAYTTKSRFHDGFDAHFCHVACFFRIKRPNSVAEIRSFETLRYEDQKLLEAAIDSKGLTVLGAEVLDINGDENQSNGKGYRKGTKRAPNKTNGMVLCNYDDFKVEYAKSNRSKCNLCDEKIDKDTVRLGKLDYEAETAWRGGPMTRWFHIECFVKSMEELEFYGKVEKLADFDMLEDEDQKMLKKKVKPLKGASKSLAELTNKRLKKSDGDDNSEEEALLKKQSDDYFALREQVNNIQRKDLELMLNNMRQKSNFKAPSMLVDMATDVLMFGPLKPCPICKHAGAMVLRGSSYICLSGTEWEPCSYETREPKRDVPDIPEEVLDKYPYFSEEYSFQVRQRVFPSKLIKAVEQKEAENNNLVINGAPLNGLSFGVITWTGVKMDKSKVTKKITTLGGKVQTSLDKSLFVILSSEKELAKETPKVEVAKNLGVPFAKPDFLFNIENKSDVIRELDKCLLDEWDGDLGLRMKRMNVNLLKENIKSRSASNMSKAIYKSTNVAKSQTVVIKNGTVVDPDSGYAEVGRVLRRGPHVYSVVLNNVDVTRDKNSFYKMQIIEHETKKLWILFRSWGRIGCGIGGNTCMSHRSVDQATQNFENLFLEKTGNEFSTIAGNTFSHKFGLYFPIELDYGQSSSDALLAEQAEIMATSKNSKLDVPVQELIFFIFDINRMQMIMKEFELDAEKMPLGKLSKKHIFEAMETLRQIEDLMDIKPGKRVNKTKLIALTNKFYSHIPQSFGDGQVQLIDSLDLVKSKNEMLTGLSEIEVAYSMCSTIDKSSDQLPVDQYYMQLECSISSLSLDGTSSEVKLILDYVSMTHAITHANYKLSIKNIFKIQREEDCERFGEHRDKQRALLWHGSRTTNFAGILSQGLRIAPSEAPVTGYMFGKGIYFADMSSKAANYCMTDPNNNIGLLLLCEVALGKMHEVFESDANLPKGLPDGCDSVKGVGKSMSDPKTHVTIEDNLLVPVGKQTANKKAKKSQLLYNEYVVYQEAQAIIRYIVQAQFVFK